MNIVSHIIRPSLALLTVIVCLSVSNAFAQDSLLTPVPEQTETPEQTEEFQSSSEVFFEGESTSKPTAEVTDIEPELFFDAEEFMPYEKERVQKSPKRLDPVMEPASKFIVIDKNHDKASIQARLVSADRAVKLGRYDAAAALYQAIQKKSPKNQAALLGYAVSLQHLGRDSEAIEAYEALLDIAPDNIDAHINMLGLVAAKYPAVALQRLLSLKSKNPNSVPLIAQTAFVQARIGKYEDAIQSYGMASSIEPKNPTHLMNLAIVADKAGMVKEAVKYYEKALDVDTIYGGGRSIPRDKIFDRLANLRL